jgi:hypothetical protein
MWRGQKYRVDVPSEHPSIYADIMTMRVTFGHNNCGELTAALNVMRLIEIVH